MGGENGEKKEKNTPLFQLQRDAAILIIQHSFTNSNIYLQTHTDILVSRYKNKENDTTLTSANEYLLVLAFANRCSWYQRKVEPWTDTNHYINVSPELILSTFSRPE